MIILQYSAGLLTKSCIFAQKLLTSTLFNPHIPTLIKNQSVMIFLRGDLGDARTKIPIFAVCLYARNVIDLAP